MLRKRHEGSVSSTCQGHDEPHEKKQEAVFTSLSAIQGARLIPAKISSASGYSARMSSAQTVSNGGERTQQPFAQ